MFAYCNNNPVNTSDPTGEFGFLTLAKALVGAAINVGTSYIAAKVTGQEYTWKDAAISAGVGFFGSLGNAWSLVAGAISGLTSARAVYRNGGSFGEVALSFVVSSVLTVASVSGELGKPSSWTDIGTFAAVETVFGSGANGVSAATNAGINRRVEQRKQTKAAESTKTSSRPQRKRPRGAVAVEVF